MVVPASERSLSPAKNLMNGAMTGLRPQRAPCVFTRHAVDRWVQRASGLGLDSRLSVMVSIYGRACPEKILTQTTSTWELTKRSILLSAATYYVAAGWRFIVSGSGVVRSIERIKPHENF
ncbi:MAG: hypothetical protein C0402_05280 [Thermodesulfovibrio sp.]|nr:hypothetical protein [Thermodesulfovibrio sp.]